MKVKTYLVKTLSEAVDQIKKEMGPKALILSTRKTSIREKWWLQPEARLEVTAAIDFSDSAAPSEPNHFSTLLQQNLQSREDHIYKLSRHLLWHRLKPALVRELSRYLMESESGVSADRLREIAAEWLMEKLPPVQSFDPLVNAERRVVVVGPTGSGKTTTIMKMAARWKSDRKKSLAIIALDHDRLGREEPLRQYTHAFKIPFKLARTQKQFQKALESFADYDLVLIDTEGCSPNDVSGVERIRKALSSSTPLWTALVLPVTLHDADLESMMSHFSPLGYQHLLMTKLDETRVFGSLYNASYRSQTSLAYFATGQKVPEDFEEATPERVIDCLLNFSGEFSVPEIDQQVLDIGEKGPFADLFSESHFDSDLKSEKLVDERALSL